MRTFCSTAFPRWSRSRGLLSALLAALVVAAYRIAAVATLRRRLAGDDLADIADIAAAHQQRLNQAFDANEHGISAAPGPLVRP